MAPVFAFALFSVCTFLALLFLKVERWRPRAVLLGIAGAAWYVFGLVGLMITTAILAVGILIGTQVPKVSRL